MSDLESSGSRWEPITGAVATAERPTGVSGVVVDGPGLGVGQGLEPAWREGLRSPRMRLVAGGAGLLLLGGVIGGTGGYALGHTGSGNFPARGDGPRFGRDGGFGHGFRGGPPSGPTRGSSGGTSGGTNGSTT